ncbi:MAG: hypothetical protein KDA42_14790, partial [Planctomycetales bacterium]|nr:hypothetical protein [Planctomycetales bacterium]
MTTATQDKPKREDQATADVPGQEHRGRVAELAAAIATRRATELDAGHDVPSAELFGMIEDLLVELAEPEFSENWTKRDWPLMESAVRMAA